MDDIGAMKPEAVSAEPLKKRASRAVALLAIQSISARFVLFAASWVLGALLSQEAFGVSGLVLVVSTFAWTFVGFGLDDVMVQRGRGMNHWEATAFRSSLAIALLTSAAVIALAPAVGWVFHEPRVVGPILILSIAFPLASLAIVPQAKLTSRMDFDYIIQWSFVELFVGQGLTIGFAWAGFGAYSFALPVPVIMGLRAIAYSLRAPPTRTRPQTGRRRGLLLRKGAMVAGSKFVNNLVSQGDYIVLGLLASTAAVGYYYFAFRLAAAPVRTIAQSLNAVLFPAMSQFRTDPARQSASAVKSAMLLAWLVSPFCFFQMAVADPVLHLFFGDKWAKSVPVIQFLSIGLAIEGIMAVTRAYLNAAGKFRLALSYSLANGIGFFCACLIGAWLGSTPGLALAISIYYLATQPLLFAFLADHTGRRLDNLVRIFVLPSLVCAFAFGLGYGASRLEGLPHGELYSIAIITLVGWPLFAAGFALVAPDVLKQLLALGKELLSRRGGPAAMEAGKAGT